MVSEYWLVTFVAQIINFLVLVWLLKHFLYAPILNAMEERQKRIAQQQDDVDRARQEAQQQTEEFRRKNAELDHAREELLATAGREVEEWKQEHLRRARTEIDDVQAQWYQAVQRERNSLLQELRRRAGQQVFLLTRHVLTHLSDVDIEKRIIDSFLNRLQQLDDEQKASIRDAIHNTHHKVAIASVFEISDEMQTEIRNAIGKYLASDLDISFVLEPDLICGIELRAAGHKLAWSAAETLEELEEHFAQELEDTLAYTPANTATTSDHQPINPDQRVQTN